MKYTMKLILMYSILLSILFNRCSDSVEPEIQNLPYVSLTVGDERQYFFETDSSTIQYTIKEKLARSDGYPVYSWEWYYGKDTIPVTGYYGIKDGFFISTELDTVQDSSYYLTENPYYEQRLAKLYPKDGDLWQNIVGDSSARYFIARNIGTQVTPAGVFNNTFSFTLDNFLSVNYSKGVGHIASIVLIDSTKLLSCYLKVNGKVYGKKIPPRDPPFNNDSLNYTREKIFNILFGSY
jgi:hypothetical protein